MGLSPSDFNISPRLPAHNAVFDDDDEDHHISIDEQRILFKIQEVQSKLEALRAINRKEKEVTSTMGEKNVGRLIMVSNRLPVSINKDENGEWVFKMSSGGLVTALSGLKKDIPFLWVGWPGIHVPEEEQEHLSKKLQDEYGLFPVFLSEKLVDEYYNGFCNDILWPLFHYTSLPNFDPGRELRFDNSLFNAYEQANQKFADCLIQAYKPNDIIWVHDYHLMLLPQITRRKLPNARIGWFLHTPFPSSDIYRILPVRNQILEGILMADLLGFHTYDYARHFLSCATRCLGLETASRGVYLKGHFCTVGVFPIGIDPSVFEKCLASEKTQQRIKELKHTFAGKKVLIGVDRLDYIKGVPHKLSALEMFFTRFPQWRGKVVLVQIAVPSRTSVIQYKLLCSEVNEMVGRINGAFGSFDYSPVHYLFTSVPLDELCALYSIADACLITSIRDGMNLVSHEYVLCQQKKCGVLVLSEFAGAARSLGTAIRINPWDSEEVADAIHRALSLSFPERKLKQTQLIRYVRQNTASAWGQGFVHELVHCGDQNVMNFNQILRPLSDEFLSMFTKSRKRLIVTDSRGILVSQRVPSKRRPHQNILEILTKLCKSPHNVVFVLSDAPRSRLDEWFKHLSLGIFSEDGAYVRWTESKQWECIVPEIDSSWKDQFMPLFNQFSALVPGAHVESTANSISWVNDDVDPDFGAWQSLQLEKTLSEELEHTELPLQVVSCDRLVKIRPMGTSKGDMINHIFQKYQTDAPFDFVFCMGDDATDDDMFLNTKKYGVPSITCRVRNTSSKADYFVPSPSDAIAILEELCDK